MHKNYKLLIFLGALIAISLLLSRMTGESRTSNFRVDLFSVPDTSRIESITIQGNEEINLVRVSADLWMVNDRFRINSNLKNVLLSLLSQVTIRRPVSTIQREEIASGLEDGTKINLQLGESSETFYVGGNPARTQSYFMQESSGQPYIVEIPGYRNYVSGIFDLTEMQWRDRTLFNTHWRSLQSVRVSYPSNLKNELNISFENEFFKIEGVEQMDTTALMGYLQIYERFEANEFIPPGFSASYDSLGKLEPLAIIELREINSDNNQRLEIFPKLERDNYVLTTNRDGELSLTDFRRIRSLLVRPTDLSSH